MASGRDFFFLCEVDDERLLGSESNFLAQLFQGVDLRGSTLFLVLFLAFRGHPPFRVNGHSRGADYVLDPIVLL